VLCACKIGVWNKISPIFEVQKQKGGAKLPPSV
jgi:hypothetical protein